MLKLNPVTHHNTTIVITQHGAISSLHSAQISAREVRAQIPRELIVEGNTQTGVKLPDVGDSSNHNFRTKSNAYVQLCA